MNDLHDNVESYLKDIMKMNNMNESTVFEKTKYITLII